MKAGARQEEDKREKTDINQRNFAKKNRKEEEPENESFVKMFPFHIPSTIPPPSLQPRNGEFLQK
jgi:hypothetical protein